MAGYQFIREECYAKVRGQGAPTGISGKARDTGSGKLSAKQVIAEAIRNEHAAPHVKAPEPPRCIYGEPADKLMTWYDELAVKAGEVTTMTAAGVKKRQRVDVPIMMGVVASYPGKADDDDAAYVAWRDSTLRFMQERYGDQLVSVLEHKDEEHGHVHAIVANDGKPIKPSHAGFSAMQKAAAEGEPKKMQSIAYQEGCRALQDVFFDQVASKVGLARLGPKKRRLTRREWHAEQQANAAIAKAHASAQAAQKRVETATAVVRENYKENDQKARQLRAKEARIELDAERVKTTEARVKAADERVKKAEAAVRAEMPKIAAADIAAKTADAERQKRIDAEAKAGKLQAEKTELEHEKNVLHNTVISLKNKLKKYE